MIEKSDVEKLAKLARIDLEKSEIARIQKDLDSILEYVSMVSKLDKIATDSNMSYGGDVNVMREDKDPHESNVYSEKILNEANSTENGYIKVKKIIDTKL